MGRLAGTAGRVLQYTAINLMTSLVWAELATTPLNPSTRRASTLGARQTFIRSWRPTGNSTVQRAKQTILEECWRPSFARSLVPKIGGPARDVEAYAPFCNEEHAHTGRPTRGPTPLQAFIGGWNMRPR